MDRIDDDAVFLAHAHDSLARHRASFGREPDGRTEADAAQRQRAPRVRFAGPAEHEAGRFRQAEPAAFVLRNSRALLALVLEAWKHGAHDVRRENLAPSYADEDIVDR